MKQYHEPPQELSQEVRTLCRIFASLVEEAEAISWYNERMSLEQNSEAKQIMAYAQDEEFRHFAMDLEFLSRQMPRWRLILKSILFTEGDITANADKVPELSQESQPETPPATDPEQLLREYLASE